MSNGKLFRTMSQRSYSCSVNSTSLNTCSSVCSMQPFSHSQQLPFRYFDSDMARKRPLVVSFRRIQKMTPNNNMSNSNSVSICDIHRMDTKLRDDVMTMKIMPKSYISKMSIQKRNCCNQSQSCRNFSFNDKQKSQLESLCDGNVFDSHHLDKGVFPKEKYHGNAKLLFTMNDEVLRKSMIDCEPHDEYADMKNNYSQRNFSSTYHSINDRSKSKNRLSLKIDVDQKKLQTITTTVTDNTMIDGYEKSQKAVSERNDPLWRIHKDDEHQLYCKTIEKSKQKKNILEYEPPEKLSKNFTKSSF